MSSKPTADAAKPAAIKAAKPAVLHRIVHAKLPPHLAPACSSTSRHVRDLHNTAIHLGRTALGCFEWSQASRRMELKDPARMPEGGAQVLAAFNAAVSKQNAKRTLKGGVKAKLLAPLDAAHPKPISTILDGLTSCEPKKFGGQFDICLFMRT